MKSDVIRRILSDVKLVSAAPLSLGVLLVIVLIRNAWIGDDAYITLRTVDNFINGYGLTWNVGERVQAYTHPLWMLLLSAMSFVTREYYYTTIFTAIVISSVAVFIYVRKLSCDWLNASIAILCFILSKPFVDYSTSGLENPVTHLILVLFFVVYLTRKMNSQTLFYLSLLAALGLLNRLDTALLFLPPLAYSCFKMSLKKIATPVILGFSPLLLWESFSLLYYGFPFPNTAYAKLNTGIDKSDLVAQGLVYLNNLLFWSPLTAMIILLSIVYVCYNRKLRLVLPVVGILLYIIYIVRVGGDFMSGRFFTAPFVVAMILLSRVHFKSREFWSWGSLSIIFLLGALWSESPLFSNENFGKGPESRKWVKGISDERAGWYQSMGLLVQYGRESEPDHIWVREGLEARKKGKHVLVQSGVGLIGFYAGPEVHVVDNHALTDPFLARLPTHTLKRWRIGHFNRSLPKGYIESLETGKNMIVDSSLSKYYDKLRLITQGPVFNTDRLKEVWRFNWGEYNYLLERYLSQPQVASYDEVKHPKKQGAPYFSRGCFVITDSGLRITFDTLVQAHELEISVDHNDDYLISYRVGAVEVATSAIVKKWIPERGLRVDTIAVPAGAMSTGFDQILILPRGGDGVYSVGHVRIL